LQDKISILLPYKENFSKENFGSVSLFVKDLNEKSKFKKITNIYGNTKFIPIKNFKYKNLKQTFLHFTGRNRTHTNQFIKEAKKNPNLKIIEVHNRPISVSMIKKSLPTKKIILYYHNDPLLMKGYSDEKRRKNLLDSCHLIYFVSKYLKNQFSKNLVLSALDKKKLHVLFNGVWPNRIKNKNRTKNIVYVGKLDKKKGFFEFKKAISNIVIDFPDWKIDIFGTNNKGQFPKSNHPNIKFYGQKDNNYVKKFLLNSSISIIPSIWNEPFGRTLIESINAGCSVISSQSGGLKEISAYFNLLKLSKPSKKSIYNALKKLIMSTHELQKLQSNSVINTPFNLTHITNYHDKNRSTFLSQ
tara:strand:+ start:840 stop:1910 length:1071 start_codon:yes stop_codon:yes gene_type:complete